MTSLSAKGAPAEPDIERGFRFQPQFDAAGLIPAIVSQAGTGEVLMFAFMTAEALALSLRTGEAHFWSRSRQRIWRKGEESANVLSILAMHTDCDQDTLWLEVTVGGSGVACHTMERSCFYRSVPLGGDLAAGIPLNKRSPGQGTDTTAIRE
jgi:phosphoribosyl-AMP cyclohydrolase